MGDTFSVHISGLRELDAQFKKLGSVLGPATLALALQQAAEPTVALARTLAPYDAEHKTRKHLRDSIKATTKLKRSQRRFVTSPGAANVFIGPSSPHGYLVEFGHKLVRGPSRKGAILSHKVDRELSGRGKGRFVKHHVVRGEGSSGRVIGQVRPYPFMRPAWDATRQQVAESLRDQLWRALLAVAKGARSAAAAGNLNRRAARSLSE